MDAKEFRDAMAALPEPADSPPPYWDHWRHDLWVHGIKDDPANFVNWPCIYHTMLVGFRDMRWRWDQLTARYRDVCKLLAPPLFENCIEEAYHLMQWEEKTGRHVGDLQSIFELGGGYGQMAWLCRKLGFTGSYFIDDVPEFELLQRWWLENQGIDEMFYGYPYRSPDLYIGIYSVSVIEPSQRRYVLVHDDPGMSYLLAYSSEMAEYNNRAWFDAWMATTGRCWQAWQMVDRPEDWYAICS